MEICIIGHVDKVSVCQTDGIDDDDEVMSGSPHIGVSANYTVEISHRQLLFAIKGRGRVPGQGVGGQVYVRVGLFLVELVGSDSPYIKKRNNSSQLKWES